MTDSASTASSGSRAGRTTRIALDLAQPGDWLEVDGTQGANPRRGEILAVLGDGRHGHFRVRRDEEHESLLFPAPEGGIIVHTTRPLTAC